MSATSSRVTGADTTGCAAAFVGTGGAVVRITTASPPVVVAVAVAARRTRFDDGARD